MANSVNNGEVNMGNTAGNGEAPMENTAGPRLGYAENSPLNIKNTPFSTEDTPLSVELAFQVEFYEVDSMEVVWHGNYVQYLERVRCALLDYVGYGYREMRASGFTFPVTHLSLKYIRPLHFGERVRAQATLEEYENCLRIQYALFNAEGQLAAKGLSTQMAFEVAKNESCFVCPPILIEKVRQLKARLANGENHA